MKNPKILFLLLSLVLFTNYINYLLPNRDKYDQEIKLLEQKIVREEKLNDQHIDPKELTLPYKHYFFDATKYNYSQAMGKFQEIITNSVQKNCKVSYLKWAPVPSSTTWYDRLTMNLSLECIPKDMFAFINRLRKNRELFYVQYLKISPNKRIQKLRVTMQLVAYRNHNEN